MTQPLTPSRKDQDPVVNLLWIPQGGWTLFLNATDPWGIRFDWGFDLESLVWEKEPYERTARFFGHQAQIRNRVIVYTEELMKNIRDLYPFDVWHLFHKAQLEEDFTSTNPEETASKTEKKGYTKNKRQKTVTDRKQIQEPPDNPEEDQEPLDNPEEDQEPSEKSDERVFSNPNNPCIQPINPIIDQESNRNNNQEPMECEKIDVNLVVGNLAYSSEMDGKNSYRSNINDGRFIPKSSSALERDKNVQQLFTPENIGYTFISHAHADHVPLHLQTRYGVVGEFREIFPFPVICTQITKDLVENRFKMRLPNWIPPNNTPNNPSVPPTLLERLRKFRSEYETHNRLTEQSRKLLSNYFNPILVNHKQGCSLMSLIPTGHVFGAAGLAVWEGTDDISNTTSQEWEINGKRLQADLVYLDECNLSERQFWLPCPFLKTHTLVIDGLFSDPMLEIPDQTQEANRFLKYVLEQISQTPIIIFCHDFGKPQFLATLLTYLVWAKKLPEDFAVVMDSEAKTIMDLCITYGLITPRVLSRQEARTLKYPQSRNYILFASPSERENPAIRSLITKRKAQTVEMTGWCYDATYRAEHPADQYFILSDHCIYPDLLRYLKQCEVDRIVLTNFLNQNLNYALQCEGFAVYNPSNRKF